MKLSRLALCAATVCLPQLARAGSGLFLPGAGAISTSRAGAGVASADDGEAIPLNPAGIAKASGTTITISAAMLQYAMQFQRRGTYDDVPGEDYPYAGQPYALVKNASNPATGFGSTQPVPVIGVLSDLGGRVPGLHLGIGVYAPNAYPFRDMCTQTASGCLKYKFNDDFTVPPPSTRYDIMFQQAAFLMPSLVAAYSVLPNLDVGLRLTAGQASLKSTTALWGTPLPNYQENVKQDAVFAVDASDNFVPGFGIGVTYRPTPNIELAANYTSEVDVHAKGNAQSTLGPEAGISGSAVTIQPVSDDMARCATGGTPDNLRACVDFALPMNATIAGRYKFLDRHGNLKGDVELDLDWENWGKTCSADSFEDGSCTSPSDYRVIVDAQAQIDPRFAGINLMTSAVHHGFKDGYGAHLGGSYHVPIGAARADGSSNEIILRGGIGYDTAVAKTGWLRADLDGAARTTLTAGAAYRTNRFEIDLGFGAALEGSPSNPNNGDAAEPCNPTQAAPSCPVPHQGPDPINPLLPTTNQADSPIAQGDYQAHYLMFMLGGSVWF
ncbi:MAG TPA: outer membrane protein transport protein [Kofleriaceae bacterium]|nr:outer membrane protein transport protein [Kofleriaceae bacterium]